MYGTLKKLRIGVWRLYQTWLDWCYVIYWQLRYILQRENPAAYNIPAARRPIEIVIIPGIYEPWQFMKPLIAKMYAHGYPVHVIEGLGYNTGDVADMANTAKRFIASLDSGQIVLIAHSKGGLIAKYLLANYNQGGRIRHAITLNTPYVGSIYAKFSPVGSIRIFTPLGPTIQQLQANKLINHQITSIYSEFDPNIPRGSHLEGATNIPIKAVGHFRIVADTDVHEEIARIMAVIEASDKR